MLSVLSLIWVTDFNGMSNCLGLFFAPRIENCLYWTIYLLLITVRIFNHVPNSHRSNINISISNDILTLNRRKERQDELICTYKAYKKCYKRVPTNKMCKEQVVYERSRKTVKSLPCFLWWAKSYAPYLSAEERWSLSQRGRQNPPSNQWTEIKKGACLNNWKNEECLRVRKSFEFSRDQYTWCPKIRPSKPRKTIIFWFGLVWFLCLMAYQPL